MTTTIDEQSDSGTAHDRRSAGGTGGRPDVEVEAVVVGGGAAGIKATIALKREGVREIAVLEKSDQLGGVWNHNRYPGVACDVPAPTYSFAAHPNDWSRLFAEGAEIREYFQRIAAENDVERHVWRGTELLDAVWDEKAGRWTCDTSKGRIRSRFLVLATGSLHQRIIPDIPGKENFSGAMFHSVDWPEDFDSTGKRVVVVGTGASAIQFIPEIQPQAERLVVLQRTPSWIVPKRDVEHPRAGKRRGLRRQRRLRMVLLAALEAFMISHLRVSWTKVLERLARRHLHNSVADPELRALLTPDYKAGCKRMLQSDDYYPAVAGENVDLVASGLAEIRGNSVVTTDGREFEVDTIIWGTGFSYGQQVLERVRGRDGRTMAEVFAGTPRTYLATTMEGCPNAFILAGPNAGLGSIPFAIEAQSRYLASAVRVMRRRGLESVEVRPEAVADWMRRKDATLRRSVWNAGGCKSFYLTSEGVNVTMWPGSMRNMLKALRSFDVQNYRVTRSRTGRHRAIAGTASVEELA